MLQLLPMGTQGLGSLQQQNLNLLVKGDRRAPTQEQTCAGCSYSSILYTFTLSAVSAQARDTLTLLGSLPVISVAVTMCNFLNFE